MNFYKILFHMTNKYHIEKSEYYWNTYTHFQRLCFIQVIWVRFGFILPDYFDNHSGTNFTTLPDYFLQPNTDRSPMSGCSVVRKSPDH